MTNRTSLQTQKERAMDFLRATLWPADARSAFTHLEDALRAARRLNENILKLYTAACPTCGSCSGMFTANSMNCLTEALGLSLPGNGTVVATHADRKELFLRAGRLAVALCRRYYEQDDASILPRSIATFDAFENAMTLDVAMGGSTNTVLHILAAAQEAGRYRVYAVSHIDQALELFLHRPAEVIHQTAIMRLLGCEEEPSLFRRLFWRLTGR